MCFFMVKENLAYGVKKSKLKKLKVKKKFLEGAHIAYVLL